MLFAVDTSNDETSCCILDAATGAVLASKNYKNKNSHAEQLFNLIEQCCYEANVKIDEINYFIASTGPGSYTGVRIGLSGLKGLAFGLSKPLLGITKFEAAAFKYYSVNTDFKQPIFICLDAKRDEFFCQEFSILNNNIVENSEQLILTSAELKNNLITKVVIDNELEAFGDLKSEKISMLDAKDFAKAANLKIKNNKNLEAATPLYIRQPDYVKTKKYQQ